VSANIDTYIKYQYNPIDKYFVINQIFETNKYTKEVIHSKKIKWNTKEKIILQLLGKYDLNRGKAYFPSLLIFKI
jgi:hypothetical protein